MTEYLPFKFAVSTYCPNAGRVYPVYQAPTIAAVPAHVSGYG